MPVTRIPNAEDPFGARHHTVFLNTRHAFSLHPPSSTTVGCWRRKGVEITTATAAATAAATATVTTITTATATATTTATATATATVAIGAATELGMLKHRHLSLIRADRGSNGLFLSHI